MAELNERFGAGGWKLVWVVRGEMYPFFAACRDFYEESYFRHLRVRPAEVDLICSFNECYDNGVSNIESGLDYSKQEAFSTHIQDIAIRNALARLDRCFAPRDSLGPLRYLEIRSKDSVGARFGPGCIQLDAPAEITQPSLAPRWAAPGTVEDFWQSNKWVAVWREAPT